MNRFASLLAAAVALVSAGCATGHGTMRGSVVMRVNPTDAHVCMGDDEVRVGDKVTLIHHVCAPTSDKSAAQTERCKRTVLGTGEVVEVLNRHYSVVRFAQGVAFAEGDTIEKQK